MDHLTEVWTKTRENIRPQMTGLSFHAWIDVIVPLVIKNGILVLEIPTRDILKTLSDFYFDYLVDAAKKADPAVENVLLVLPEDHDKYVTPEDSEPIDVYALNPKYTFDSFVVGSSNHFPHAAAQAVAQNPGTAYNPLFIYGGVGLGKTHLMHAIGHYVKEHDPSATVMYVTSETFTNELINAIQQDKRIEFRKRFRNVDVLMIDDVQFISKSQATQEEFFNTFNTLHNANKQIVISSDRPPKEIAKLEERLCSRFEWGLIADIQPPDYETRMAIIHVKADSLRVQLPEDVVDYIAKTITSNVRQLEGTVKKIKALHDLMERAIDIELAKEAVADIFKENPGLNPTPEMILREVSRYYCTPVEKLKGSGRSKDLVLPRQVAMYLVRDLTDYSLPEIGKIFSRDHTTVLHSINKIENYLKETSEMDNIIKTLKTNIRG